MMSPVHSYNILIMDLQVKPSHDYQSKKEKSAKKVYGSFFLQTANTELSKYVL